MPLVPEQGTLCTLAIATAWGKAEQTAHKQEGGAPLPAVRAVPRGPRSERYSTQARPARDGRPHCPEIHCQATDQFWGKSANMSHKKD